VTSFEKNHEELTARNPDCREEIGLLRNGLRTIGQFIHTSPSVNGNGAVWKKLINRAEAEKTVLREHLDGKALLTAILRLHAAIHRDMRDSLLPEKKETSGEFSRTKETQAKPFRRASEEIEADTWTEGPYDKNPR
jgi:hypothetical protein